MGKFSAEMAENFSSSDKQSRPKNRKSIRQRGEARSHSRERDEIATRHQSLLGMNEFQSLLGAAAAQKYAGFQSSDRPEN